MSDLIQQFNALSTTSALAKLDAFSIVDVSGEDAFAFLQRIITADLRELTTKNTLLSSICNLKGRVICLFQLYKDEQSYYLVLPQTLVDKTITLLSSYIFRAKVKVTQKPDLQCIGVCGQSADQTLSSVFSSVPTVINQIQQDQGVTLIYRFNHPHTYLLIATKSIVDQYTVKLQPLCQQSTPTLFTLIELGHYYTMITDKTTTALLPQEIELERLGGLSYKKGCFVGQEVIAKLHYKGKLKHSLRLVDITTNQALQPLTSITDTDNTTLGRIIALIKINKQTYRCLILLKHDAHLKDQTLIPLMQPSQSSLLLYPR